jgi:hypothetical protein
MLQHILNLLYNGIKENEMGMTCGTYGIDDKCIRNFIRKI